MNKRLHLLVLTVVLVCQPVNAVADALQIKGPTMGTYYKVIVDSPADDLDGNLLQSVIVDRLNDINTQMSTWDDSSEISTFNRSNTTDWFGVSAEFAAVVVEAKRIHELTESAFDPTVEPLIRLWGFGDGRKKEVASQADVLSAQKMIGMQYVQVRLEPPALKKSIPELQLNLSAIAKGYAVDAIADLLIEEGLQSYVVDIGGENKAGTAKASGDPWKLGVESPLGGLQRVVRLTESAIATSGDYRNFFQIEGVTYSHAIDPTTGWPVKDPPASVSVVCDSCMTADAWATAMMVLGTERGIKIAKANQLSVMFQEVHGDSITQSSTGLFAISDATQAPVVKNKLPEKKSSSAPWFPFVAAAVIFLIAVAGMAIGTMLQNKSLKGSCGGLASMPGSEGKSICELCTIPKDECTNAELKAKMQAAAESVDEDC